MGKNQLERKLRDVLVAKSPIHQPGRVMAHLLNELALVPDRSGKSEAELVSLLEAMAESGEIAIDRRGSKLWDGVTYLGLNNPIPTPECGNVPAIYDSTTSTPEGELTTRGEPEMGETEPQKSGSRVENVNAALRVLRKAADPATGEIRQASAAAIIAEGLGVSMAVANHLNGALGKLGFRVTEGAKTTLVHLIDMSDKQATEEELQAIDSKDEIPEVSEQIEPADEQTNPLVEIPEGSTPEEELVDIIEDLDKKLAAALEENERLKRENRQLTQAVIESAETIEQLTQQLNTPRVSDRVYNTLKKYKKETDLSS